ncbi:hypothetical protein ACLKA7_009294 [Drosophila subpalustris]
MATMLADRTRSRTLAAATAWPQTNARVQKLPYPAGKRAWPRPWPRHTADADANDEATPLPTQPTQPTEHPWAKHQRH